MKKLKIDMGETEEEIIRFEEHLGDDGTWRIATFGESDFKWVREIPMKVMGYRYFMAADEKDSVLIYRCSR